jgi:outer membrane protein OmpA-like peptidoglycan-associated protein
MTVLAIQRAWPLLVCCLGSVMLAACAGQHDKPGAVAGAASGGLPQRVVIGGMGNVVAGTVIARYMDDQARELKPLADTLRAGDGIIVTLPEKILFKVNSAQLEPQSRRLLRKVAAILDKYSKTRLTIVGHTDDRGFASFDIHLSERRAKSVADDFVAAGVARPRIRIMGMGFERPVAANDTVEGRARNRRVEIHVAPDDKLRAEDRSPKP